jgi:hypothetical protein
LGQAGVVTGDRAELGSDRAVGDQRLELGVGVDGEQPADARVLDVVLLAGGTATAGDQVRVDRHHGEPGRQQRLDQQPVAGLQHHPHPLGGWLQPSEVVDEAGQAGRGMFDPADLGDSGLWSADGHDMERLGPVQPDAQHPAHLLTVIGPGAPRRPDGQSSQDNTLDGVTPLVAALAEAPSRRSPLGTRTKSALDEGRTLA